MPNHRRRAKDRKRRRKPDFSRLDQIEHFIRRGARRITRRFSITSLPRFAHLRLQSAILGDGLDGGRAASASPDREAGILDDLSDDDEELEEYFISRFGAACFSYCKVYTLIMLILFSKSTVFCV